MSATRHHMGPTGVCTGCGKPRALRGDGTVRRHRRGFPQRHLVCAGSHRDPADEPVTVTAEQIMAEYASGGVR